MLYQIHWRSLVAGATEHGNSALPLEEARRYADALNKEYAELLYHWMSAKPLTQADASSDSVEPEQKSDPARAA